MRVLCVRRIPGIEEVRSVARKPGKNCQESGRTHQNSDLFGEAVLADERETIHAPGEVIPPETPVESNAPRPRDSFAAALAIAIAADLLQIVLFPLLAEGLPSPLDDVLDIVVGIGMVKLVGWHWAFLPSFLGKLIPLFDELPCWTLAVLFVRAERAKLQSV